MSDQPNASPPESGPDEGGGPGRRVFFALPVDQAVRDRLATVSASLRKAAHFTPARITWVAPENLHLTLHFLGRVEEDRVQALIAALPAFAAARPAIPLAFHGLGYFPHDRAPRVLWVGVRAVPPSLPALVDELATMIRQTGVSLQHDNFHAHVTLARFKALKGTAAFVQQAGQFRNKAMGSMTADRLCLMESTLTPSGPIYQVIGEGRLGAGAA